MGFYFFPIYGFTIGAHYINSDEYPELFADSNNQVNTHAIQLMFGLFGISVLWQ